MLTIIDFKYGKVTYNEFCIDFNIPFSEQLDCLLEDLVQVEYDNGYILDLGWYPEYDCNGSFIVQIIKKYEWNCPVFYKKCNSERDLKIHLTNAVKFVSLLRI